MKLGIDVSYHNGEIDWQAVKARGVEFVIARCGYGPKTTLDCTVDETFLTNVEQAHKHGLQVGTYFYSYALNPEEAQYEASFVKDFINKSGILLDREIYYDIEDPDNFKVNNNFDFSRENITAICKAFLNEISPLHCGVYASLDWLDNYIDWKALNCSVWSAQWVDSMIANSNSIEYLTQFDQFKGYLWQFTDSFNINGKLFDANILYI